MNIDAMIAESEAALKGLNSVDAPAAAKPSLIRRTIADPAISLLKGAIAVPEAAVGIADMATMGYAGKLAEKAGFRPKEAKATLDTLYSPEQQQMNREVTETEGFFPTIAAAVKRPSVIAHSVLESAPGMLASGGVARGALKLAPKAIKSIAGEFAPVVAGAAGEGVFGTGSAAEQIRQETEGGVLTPKQAGLAAASGLATSAFGLAGGAFARRLGIADVDTMLANGKLAGQSKTGAIKGIAGGMLSEGVFEEMPQSAQEQVMQNLALGKPWNERVAESAAMGGLAGAAMGGGGQILSHAANVLQKPGQPGPESDITAVPPGGDTVAGGVAPSAPPAAPATPDPLAPGGNIAGTSIIQDSNPQPKPAGTLVNALAAGGIAVPPVTGDMYSSFAGAPSDIQPVPAAGSRVAGLLETLQTVKELDQAIAYNKSLWESGQRGLMQNTGTSEAQFQASLIDQFRKAQEKTNGTANILPDMQDQGPSQVDGARLAVPALQGTPVGNGSNNTSSGGITDGLSSVQQKTVETQEVPPVRSQAVVTPKEVATVKSQIQSLRDQAQQLKNKRTVFQNGQQSVVSATDQNLKESEALFAQANDLENHWYAAIFPDDLTAADMQEAVKRGMPVLDTGGNQKPLKTNTVKAATVNTRRQLDSAKDSLPVAVAKLGGISRAEIDKQTGTGKDLAHTLDTMATKEAKAGIMHVISSKGMPLDQMREALVEQGYLTPDGDINELLDKLDSASRGTVHRSSHSTDAGADAYREAEIRYSEMINAMTDGEYEEFSRNQWLDEQVQELADASDILDEYLDSLDNETMTTADWQAVENDFREALDATEINAGVNGEAEGQEQSLDAGETGGVPENVRSDAQVESAAETGETAQPATDITQKDKLFATPPTFGKKPQPSSNGDLTTGALLDSFTSAESVQPELQPTPTDIKAVKSLAAEPSPATSVQPVTPAKTKVTDAGEELVYNKRNRVKSGLKWDDIKDKNDALKAKEVQKGNIYPKPDYAAMVEGGMEPIVAHIVKQVYDSISVKPDVRGIPSNADFQLYITAVNRVMEGTLQWANDKNAVAAWAGKQAKVAGASLGRQISLTDLGGVSSLFETVYPGGWRNFSTEVNILDGRKLFKALQPGYEQVNRAIKDVGQGWPAQVESWQKQGYKIIPVDGFSVKESNWRDGSTTFSVVKQNNSSVSGTFDSHEKAQAFMDGLQPFVLFNKRGRMVDSFATEEQAREAARTSVKKEGGVTVEERGVNVADAERTGPEFRAEGENVTAEQLMETIGFKGVNFGNWVPNDERQLHLNHAYDSFLDLAAVLNLPPRALSLNGMLGLAIGAQGSGSYAAHFVPGVNEINITRTMGAGSVAHEWAHAIDHYFATQAGFAASPSPWMTVIKRNGNNGEVRQEVVTAFADIVRAMKEREATPEELAERAKSLEDSSRKKLESWLKYFEKEFAVNETAASELAVLVRRIREGDYQHGEDAYVTIVPGRGRLNLGTAVLSVVADIRDLAKKYKIKIPTDNIKALDSNVSFVKYLEEKKNDDHKPQIAMTRYQAAANKLDKDKKGKPYWSTPLEMFARAFDAYVTDKLATQTQNNDYLSHTGRSGDTVPMGEERTAINAAFDVLISGLETKETDKGVALYKRGEATPEGVSLTVDELEVYAHQLVSGKNVPGIVVKQRVSDLPFSSPGNAKAALWDGSIYLVANNISDAQDARGSIAHELIGHFGLRGFFGSDIGPALDVIHDRNPLVRKYAEEWVADNQDVIRDQQLTATDIKYRSIEEAMSQIAEEGKPFSYAHRLVQFVQQMLRKIGLDKWADTLEAKTNAEALQMLRKSELYIKHGLTSGTPIPKPLYPLFMTAWHGSPHDHDGFSTEHIGSGEGAQAYGWGLYFAEAQEVAEWYKNTLSRYRYGDHIVQMAQNYLQKNNISQDPTENHGYTNPQDYIKLAESYGFEFDGQVKGRLYQVELAPKDDEYLLWDKHLSEQSEKVQTALKDIDKQEWVDSAGQPLNAMRRLKAIADPNFAKENGFKKSLSDITGEELYRKISLLSGGKSKGSAHLHSLGIRGIKYLDGASRNRSMKDISKAFLAALPEDAEFDEVIELIGSGTFSHEQETLLKALEANDWLGFDYPSQAISAALGNHLNNFDPDQKLQDAVKELAKDQQFNYVIFNDADVNIQAKFKLFSSPTPGVQATEAQAWVSTLPIAAHVNVVQSVDDLPETALNEIIKAEVNPAYVQAMELNGTIHVIADNVPNLRRIKALVIGHELAHAGQSKKIVDLAVDWFKRTKDGKTEHAREAHIKLERIADLYDLDLTDENQFRRAVQEATAAIAEQVADGTLKPVGLMQRLFMYIKHWLRQNGLISHVSDSELSLAVAEMLRIGEKRLSVGKGGSETQLALSDKTKSEYENRIDELFKPGAKPNMKGGIRILDRSDVLGLLNYSDKPVELVEGKVIKGMGSHNLKAEHWKKIPQWLDDPAMVFDSATEPGRLVFVAKELVNASPVLMIVNPENDVNKVHLLVNAYDKDNERGSIRRWVDDGLLRYYTKVKNAALDRSRLQLPSLSQVRRSDNLKIYRDSDLVKYKNNAPIANFALLNDQIADQAAKINAAIPGVISHAKDNWASIVNPLDFSRTARWFDNWTPDVIKSGFGYFFNNPFFEGLRDAAKKVFVEEGADRELNRMSMMLQMFGYTPGKVDTRGKLEQFKDFVTKWHSGVESTDWEKLNMRYLKLSKEQQAAMDILTVQGDANNTYYGSYRAAMLNRKNQAAKLTEETFNLYKDVYAHMQLVSKIREQQIEHMLLESGKSKAEVDKTIADYRKETREVAGWMTRNHGDGNYVTAVHHVVKDLKFTIRDIKGEAQQAFLPYYPGSKVMAEIEKIAGTIKATVTLTGKGAVVVTAAEGQKLDGFKEAIPQIIPELNQRIIDEPARLQKIREKVAAKGATAAVLGKIDKRIETAERAAKDPRQMVMVYSRRHNVKGAAASHADQVKADLKKHMPENYRYGEEYVTSSTQADTLNEDLFQNMPNDIAMQAGLEKAVEAALKHGEIDSDEMEALKSRLIQDTAEVLLGRAAGKYQIRRAPYLIEGYDTANVMSGYQDYITGVAGMLSKAEYASKQFKHLTEAGIPVKPWAYKYVFDSLRNQGMADRISGNARAFVSLWYMGLKPASAIINATQIYTLGVAEIGRIIGRGESATIRIAKAQKDALSDKLTMDEKEIFNSAVMYQQEAATALSQITGHNEGGTGKASRILHNVTGKAMALFQNIEVLNRKTIILAAYRVLRNKELAAGVIDHAALKQALEINNSVNFDQGRHNLPGWARNPLGQTLYALQSFTWNNLNWIYTRATSGERRDMIALLRYTGMLMLIGGAGALAGGDELDKLYRKLRGKSLLMEAKQWTHQHSKEYGTLGEMVNAFAWHGMAGLAGLNISNSMRLQIPVASQMLGDATMPEAIGGVWAGLAKKAWLSSEALAKGDMYRAVESAAPEALAGGMRAYRQYDKGMTTLKGRPVFDENGQPLKYSAVDAVLRTAGFQPAEQSRRMEVAMTGKNLVSWWKDEREDLLAKLRISKQGERQDVMGKILRFNRDVRKSQAWGKVGVINMETISRALTFKPDKKDMAWKKSQLD